MDVVNRIEAIKARSKRIGFARRSLFRHAGLPVATINAWLYGDGRPTNRPAHHTVEGLERAERLLERFEAAIAEEQKGEA